MGVRRVFLVSKLFVINVIGGSGRHFAMMEEDLSFYESSFAEFVFISLYSVANP